MKKTSILILILLAGSAMHGMAQNFSGKTNDIHLNYTDPAYATMASALPVINWVTPQMEYTNSQDPQLVIEATVKSDIAIKSVKIILGDGTQVRGEKVVEVLQPLEVNVKQTVHLLDGQNVIEILAENAKGAIISSSRSVLMGKDAIADVIAINRKDYALLFATDKYDNWADLVNPVDDAQSLAKVLKEKYGFETEIMENPNIEDVFIKLSEYGQRNFKPQDQLMIFFAGHGYFDEAFGEGFVVARNSLENDRAKTTYISHNRLRGVINNIPSQHIFLAMDVCFGGTFDPVIASSRGMDSGESTNMEFLVRKLGTKTRKYLTSGGKEYVSDGIPGKHSPFTLKMLQALSDGGGADHIMTLAELRSYVEKLKPEPRLGGFGDDKPDSDFVFVSKN